MELYVHFPLRLHDIDLNTPQELFYLENYTVLYDYTCVSKNVLS